MISNVGLYLELGYISWRIASLAKWLVVSQFLIHDHTKIFRAEQHKDDEITMVTFPLYGTFSDDCKRDQQVAVQAPLFAVVDEILYFVDTKQGDCKQCVVLRHLCETLMEEHHSGWSFLMTHE